MNFPKPMNLPLTTLLFLIFSNSLFSQKLEPKTRTTEPDHTIISQIMGKDYQLFISFPQSYSTKDTISYPVLYYLDGRYAFPLIRGTRSILDWGNEIEDVIIIGIGSGSDYSSWSINRFYDYTTSQDTIYERNIEKEYGAPKGYFKSGGAAKFLECLKTEIIPFVEKNYKSNTDRGLSGHSLGSLFTMYCFLNTDGYFTRFGINSPTLWWDNEKLLNQAVSQFSTNKTWDIPPTKVFLSVGEKEKPHLIPTMDKFRTSLESSDYKNIDLNWQIFDNESHLSVVPANVSRTISTLYDKK